MEVNGHLEKAHYWKSLLEMMYATSSLEIEGAEMSDRTTGQNTYVGQQSVLLNLLASVRLTPPIQWGY